MVFEDTPYEEELEEEFIQRVVAKGIRYGIYSTQLMKELAEISHERFKEGLKDPKMHNKRVSFRNYLLKKARLIIKKKRLEMKKK